MAARSAARRISRALSASGSSGGRSLSSNSLWPMMAVRMLLNSCATPPASLPTVSIFWDWNELGFQPLVIGDVFAECSPCR